jgi:hypothetical protein
MDDQPDDAPDKPERAVTEQGDLSGDQIDLDEAGEEEASSPPI